MSIRKEILQQTQKARRILNTEQVEKIVGFLRSRMCSDGGFAGRSSQSDLYYTVFGVESLIALGADVPENLREYLEKFSDGQGLDFVHLCCLVRCIADTVPQASRLYKVQPPFHRYKKILRKIESFRTADGGFSPFAGDKTGTAYGCFLATAAYQDCRQSQPHADAVEQCVNSLQAPSGGFSNDTSIPAAMAPATAAAITTLKHLQKSIPPETLDYLESLYLSEGGFPLAGGIPAPDLLSSAVVLFALKLAGRSVEKYRTETRGWIISRLDQNGGFRSACGNSLPDCEYTFYSLLALGCLA